LSGVKSPTVITNTARIGSASPETNTANNLSTVVTPLILPGGSAIIPKLECVMDKGASANPRYVAVFGYENQNAFARLIGVGNDNRFTPTPQDRDQPTVLLPGRQTNVFFVPYSSGSLTWTLTGNSVTASSNSKGCASTTQIVSGVVFLDANGNGLRDNRISEPGLPLVVVNLVNVAGTVLDTRLTRLDGSYGFVVNNPSGVYVQVIHPPLTGLRFTTKYAGGGGNTTNNSAIDPVTWQTADLGTLPNPLTGTVNAGLKP